jgi:hypothetical protein
MLPSQSWPTVSQAANASWNLHGSEYRAIINWVCPGAEQRNADIVDLHLITKVTREEFGGVLGCSVACRVDELGVSVPDDRRPYINDAAEFVRDPGKAVKDGFPPAEVGRDRDDAAS